MINNLFCREVILFFNICQYEGYILYLITDKKDLLICKNIITFFIINKMMRLF